MAVTIAVETPLQDEVRELVRQLNAHLLALAPPEACFMMTVEEMADSDTTLFVARDETGRAVGMGALKVHSSEIGEVKRMWTDPAVRGKRIGSALLDAIESLAAGKGLSALMLETGSLETMPDAHRLYTRGGFVERGPFADYLESEHSVFYEKPLAGKAAA
jgi:putative acetyltransferase